MLEKGRTPSFYGRVLVQALVLTVVLAEVGAVRAAVIQAGGEALGIADWHSTGGTPKPFAVANNVYGNDGYVLFGVTDSGSGTSSVFGQNFVASNDAGATVHQGAANFSNGLPAYVSSLNPGAQFNSVAWNFAPYASGDDPRLPSAASVADAQIGGIVSPINQTVGDFVELLTFTVGANAPGQSRVGIAFGTVSTAYFSPTALQMSVNGGDAETVVVSDTISGDADTQLNWIFFDLLGAQSGDLVSMLAQVRNRPGSANNRVVLSGISFDTIVAPVPEPTTFLMLAYGLLGWMAVRRRSAR